MTDLVPHSDGQQLKNGQMSEPNNGARVVQKRPRISAPMPIHSPYEKQISLESRRLIRLHRQVKGR